MTDERTVIRITPTPAAQEMRDEDLLKLSRITTLPLEQVREHVSTGKSIKIVTRPGPKVEKVAKFMKSIGFSVTLSRAGDRALAMSDIKRARPAPPKDPSGSARELTEWKVGDVFENLYEVRDIKYGGMGAVYVVRHMRWNTMMAVKSLYDRLREKEEDRALFLKEAETWIDIGFHPNIAACYYVRNVRGSPRIFIEYANGGALHEYLAQRRRTGWDLLIDLMVQTADGLAHAHAKGLVHRDVKPANCMLTKGGVLKVTDFGLTKRRGRDKLPEGKLTTAVTDLFIPEGESVTAAGMGTPAYMAPEMWMADSDVGPPADIYAFGVMYFEMCCGRKPFVVKRGDRPNKLALAHLKKTPPRPTSIRKNMPKEIEDIILKCLRKDPNDRYSSFLDVREDLTVAYERVFRSSFTRERPDEVKLLSDALNNRAVSLMDLNHQDEAGMALKRAVESDPHHPEAGYNLGLLEWLRTGDPDRELVVRMEEVVKAPEYTGRGGHLLGRCLLALGDAEGALKACELSLSAEDATEGLLKPYGVALIGMGKDKDAVAHLETYLDEFPNDDEGSGWLIGALVRLGRMAEARSRLEALPKSTEFVGLSLEEISDSFIFSGLSETMILKGHTGWVTCLTNFPKSRKCMTGARDRTLKTWDLLTGEELGTISVIGEPPAGIRISPDEKLAAIVGTKAGAPVNMLDLESGRIVGRLLAQEGVTEVAFSPDQRHVLTVEEKGAARLWDLADFKAVSTFKIPPHTAAAAIFDNRSRPEIFVGGKDRIVKRIGVLDGQTTAFDRGHDELVITVKAAADGGVVLTGGRDKRAILWDARTGKSLMVFQAHRDQITQVALNPGKSLAASYDAKSGIKMWDYRSGLVVRTFSTDDGQTICLEFDPTGGRLMAGGRDMALRVWDTRGRAIWPELALARIRPVKKQMISDREFNQMLNTAKKALRKKAYATAYSMVRKAQTLPGYERSDLALETILRMKEHGRCVGLYGGWNRKTLEAPSGVMDVSFSPSAINFLTAQSNHSVRMWSTKTGECLKVLAGHTNLVAALSFSVNGREAVSGGDDRTVRTWDLNTGRNSAELHGHSDSVSCVTYSPDGKMILSGSWDRTIKLWRLPEGSVFKTFKGHEDKISAVSFVGRGGLIVSAGFRGVVKMWELESGRILRDMKGHTQRITSLRVSPDGDTFITGSMDGTVRVWDAKKGTAIRTLEVDESGLRAVDFSPDRHFALTAGNDAILRIWNLETGECLREFQGHGREITAAEFSSNGRFALTASADGSIIIWELDWDWAFAGQTTAGRAQPAKT